MVSGYGANPIFFNKKNKDWTSRTLANPSPPTSENISFLPYPHPPQSGHHMCITPNGIYVNKKQMKSLEKSIT